MSIFFSRSLGGRQLLLVTVPTLTIGALLPGFFPTRTIPYLDYVLSQVPPGSTTPTGASLEGSTVFFWLCGLLNRYIPCLQYVFLFIVMGLRPFGSPPCLYDGQVDLPPSTISWGLSGISGDYSGANHPFVTSKVTRMPHTLNWIFRPR